MARHNNKELIRLYEDNENGEMGSGQSDTTLLYAWKYPEGGIRSLQKSKITPQKESHKTATTGGIQNYTPRNTQWMVCIPRNGRHPQKEPPGNTYRNENLNTPGTLTKILNALITFYQKAISPYLPHNCRFDPTCSEYTKHAIIKFGPLKGTIKGLLRILRCNPLFPGGYDPL